MPIKGANYLKESFNCLTFLQSFEDPFKNQFKCHFIKKTALMTQAYLYPTGTFGIGGRELPWEF